MHVIAFRAGAWADKVPQPLNENPEQALGFCQIYPWILFSFAPGDVNENPLICLSALRWNLFSGWTLNALILRHYWFSALPLSPSLSQSAFFHTAGSLDEKCISISVCGLRPQAVAALSVLKRDLIRYKMVRKLYHTWACRSWTYNEPRLCDGNMLIQSVRLD